eukprot:TRINITY_DN4461_c0_g1_i1.p1 TRINITY_DN4461_c0_g1~~TRINITY_DN4461_c0_g1_i1.p1  ORF type:complete len:406 (+),score=98.20 TRINITY_DN4461_c0_g1_i1:106-1323(+)
MSLKLRAESGRQWLNHKNPAWKLHKGKGDREFTHHINFEKPFTAAPRVFLALSAIDIENNEDHRISSNIQNITPIGFDVEIGTWQGTKVWGVCVTFFAFEKADVPGARIDTGRMPLKKVAPGYKLDKGQGSRTFVSRANFGFNFGTAPHVFLGISGIDSLAGEDLRLNFWPEGRSPTGFDVHVNTWKKSSIWSASIVWLAFDNNLIESQNARVELGSLNFLKNTPGYSLNEGSGDRTTQQPLDFAKEFTDVPKVITALKMIDADHEKDVRIKSQALDITTKNAKLEVGTWLDSAIYGLHLNWLAYLEGDVDPPASSSSTTTTTTSSSHATESPPPSSSSTTTTTTSSSSDDDLCKVCYTEKINTVTLNCGHLALCLDCSKIIMKNKDPCVICRGKITKIIQTYNT